MTLTALKLFKTCPMKPVWVLSCFSGRWENCASAIFARRWNSHSPRSPVIWQCSGKVVYCWIASRGNGFTIAYPRIFLLGRSGD